MQNEDEMAGPFGSAPMDIASFACGNQILINGQPGQDEMGPDFAGAYSKKKRLMDIGHHQ